MKCPRCWAEKAYCREVRGWTGILLTCLLLRPMRCHHCYHKFVLPWFLTLGKPVTPPPLRIVPISQSGPSYAARYLAAMRSEAGQPACESTSEEERRADAA